MANETHVDARDVEVIRIGTPLRDAAVDPRPGDFLVPTNAGLADPHGPRVVAVQSSGRLQRDEALVARAAAAHKENDGPH